MVAAQSRSTTAARGGAAAWRVDPPPSWLAVQALRPRVVTVNAARRPDPSKTAGTVAQFEAEIRRRFARLIARIRHEVVAEDGFGLEVNALHVHRPRYDFPRSDQKVAAFMRWLRTAQREEILSIREGVPVRRAARTAWTNVYVESAYQKGIADAGAKLRAGGAEVADSWVSGAFNRPIHADRIGQIYTRTFTELDGVTKAMDRQLSAVLAQGLAEGRGPQRIARLLTDRVEKIGITRARLIARTEVMAAHADATLNAYEEAGVEGVEVEAEWITARDDAVCPKCEELEGRVFSLAEARNMLPLHPNCRCAWLPKVIAAAGVTLNWRMHRGRARPKSQVQRRPGRHSHRALSGAHAHGHSDGDDRRGCAERGARHR